MPGRSRKRIYVLEGEPQLRILLEAEWSPAQVLVQGFCRTQECLEKLATEPCDLIILDLEGRAEDGLAMLRRVRQTVSGIPCLAIVEPRAVIRAVEAVKAGAFDCLEKPLQPDRLKAIVGAQLANETARAHRRLRTLTPTELQILQLLTTGATSREMAAQLHRSEQTIIVHRKNIRRKLHATSLVDLVKWALEMGLDGSPRTPPDGETPDSAI